MCVCVGSLVVVGVGVFVVGVVIVVFIWKGLGEFKYYELEKICMGVFGLGDGVIREFIEFVK